MIDLRSDTVTTPTPDMRAAMAAAEVGDDVFGDDPTVAKLEERVARMLGHAAGLFVPSGTMGNCIAIRCHTDPGDEVLAEYGSHIFNNEGGGAAALWGATIHPLHGDGGLLSVSQLERAIRADDPHHSRTRLIAIENTHNSGGGAIYPLPLLEQIAAFGRERELRLHLDGARLWNAAAETGVPLATYGRLFDSVSVCLSKGLGTPVGSVLVGDEPFIKRARRTRKMLGGGMRQVGVLAAAGLYALDHHLPRLREDHENARAFAKLACEAPGVKLGQRAVETNIVYLDVTDSGVPAPELQRRLHAAGVYILALGPHRMRAVTHHQVSRADVEKAARTLREAVAGATV
jgi:threonine aldolase